MCSNSSAVVELLPLIWSASNIIKTGGLTNYAVHMLVVAGIYFRNKNVAEKRIVGRASPNLDKINSMK